MTVASAPGKAILLGEHAVVYARPAIAVPVSDVRATVRIVPSKGEGIQVRAEDLGRSFQIGESYSNDDSAEALLTTVQNCLEWLGQPLPEQSLDISIASDVPIARGMGSGAAVATALVRCLAAHFGRTISNEDVSNLVFQTEIVFHGSPSGIDNTVIAHEAPVFFCRGEQPTTFAVGQTLHLIIADTGVPSKTRDTVAAVRAARQAAPSHIDSLFDAISDTVLAARDAIRMGSVAALGQLMSNNHELLCQIGVSSPELNALVRSAHAAGALGAKLSGGGGGGCMLALVEESTRAAVSCAMESAGAVQIWQTALRASEPSA